MQLIQWEAASPRTHRPKIINEPLGVNNPKSSRWLLSDPLGLLKGEMHFKMHIPETKIKQCPIHLYAGISQPTFDRLVSASSLTDVSSLFLTLSVCIRGPWMGVLALISDPKLVSKVVSNEESGDIPGLPEI